jgi:DNA-binding NarL/FixJ family response regulator
LPKENATCENDIRVWIIEDEPDFREMLREMLDETEGIVCDRSFGSVESALPAFSEDNLPDVVLVDLQLPGANGVEVIKHLKASYPALHSVVLTISDDRSSVFNAICAGASGYLIKNDPLEKIVDGIRLVCKGGSPLSGTIAAMVLTVFQGAREVVGEYELTARETEILRMLSQGISKKEIVDDLSIAPHTVDFHLRNIYGKLHVHSQAGAVGKALRKGLI